MRRINGLRQVNPILEACALTLGNFDGVHVGHQALLSKLLRFAGTESLPSVLLTFDPHPIQVLQPDRPFKRLFTLEDMVIQAGNFGVDNIIVEPFTEKLASLSASRFLNESVGPRLNPRVFVVGHDFALGSGRGGNLDFLKRWCADNQIKLWVHPPVELRGERVSSRRIRELIETGDVTQAAKMLGRLFYVQGVVEKGAGRGKVLGVPTLNTRLPDRVIPKRGVYVTRTTIEGKNYRSVSNLGSNPTFVASGQLGLETHVLDFEGDVYGLGVEIQFIRRLRDELKFSSPFELVAQIQADIKAARAVKDPNL